MLHRSSTITRSEFEQHTGWVFKPEGACKGDVCIPLRDNSGDNPNDKSAMLDLESLAEQMGMPLISSPQHKLWALGPESVSSRALTSASAPPLSLPDLAGKPFDLASLRGKKVVVYAWAPY